MLNEVVEGYLERKRVKKGVKGWEKINGWRGEIENEEKISMRKEYDIL